MRSKGVIYAFIFKYKAHNFQKYASNVLHFGVKLHLLNEYLTENLHVLNKGNIGSSKREPLSR